MNLISIEMRGMKEVQKYLKELPYGVKKVVLPPIAEYLLGDERHGYRYYPPLSTQAYLKHVPPSYVRTGDTRNSWRVVGEPYQPKIVSSGVPYVPYIRRWKKYGWREWKQVALDNMKGAMVKANAALRKYLKAK